MTKDIKDWQTIASNCGKRIKELESQLEKAETNLKQIPAMAGEILELKSQLEKERSHHL